METVLITGGSRGIGADAVRRFSDAGYKVIFTWLHSEECARRLAEQTGAIAVSADVSSSEDMRNVIDQIIITHKHIDVLVNNAGVDRYGLMMDATDEDYYSIMDINLYGVFNTTKNVLPHMVQRRKGCIINVASLWGEVGAAGEVLYSASKAAVIGMTKALAKEVASAKIRVNCISPGVIATQMNDHLTMKDVREICEITPLGHIGKTEDISNAMLFLAGDGAGFITGQVLSVNGGLVI